MRGARQKLEKCRGKLRKKKAVKQYHAAAHFKDSPLRSSAQIAKFGDDSKFKTHCQVSETYCMPFKTRLRSAHPYKGTSKLHVEQECIITLMKYTKNWPLKCLAHKFLGSYDEAAVKVIRNVLITWTAFLNAVLKSEQWWVDPDVCHKVRNVMPKVSSVVWDYIGDCTICRSEALGSNRDANTWLYGAYYSSRGGKYAIVIVPNGAIVGTSTTFGAGTGDRKIMRHMGVFDSQPFRRLTCTCENFGEDDCQACRKPAVFAYDAAVTDAVIGEFRDAKVDILVSGVRKEHKDDKLECGPRSLAQYISSERIKVECVIGMGKQEFKVLSDRVPSWWVPQIDKIVFNCCMLHNFRYRVLN